MRTPTAVRFTASEGGHVSTAYADLLARVSVLGRDDASGRDARVRFYLEVARATTAGVIDLTKDKHGEFIDDAAQLSGAYGKAQARSKYTQKVITSMSVRASCLRMVMRLALFDSKAPAHIAKLYSEWKKSTEHKLLDCAQLIVLVARYVKRHETMPPDLYKLAVLKARRQPTHRAMLLG